MRGLPQIRISNPMVEDLTKDIEDRKSMQRQMVGSLYPSIMEGEIQVLYKMREALRYKNCTHDFYTESDFNESEVLNKNIIWVAVVLNAQNICRRCGYHEQSDV